MPADKKSQNQNNNQQQTQSNNDNSVRNSTVTVKRSINESASRGTGPRNKTDNEVK